MLFENYHFSTITLFISLLKPAESIFHGAIDSIWSLAWSWLWRQETPRTATYCSSGKTFFSIQLFKMLVFFFCYLSGKLVTDSPNDGKINLGGHLWGFFVTQFLVLFISLHNHTGHLAKCPCYLFVNFVKYMVAHLLSAFSICAGNLLHGFPLIFNCFTLL